MFGKIVCFCMIIFYIAFYFNFLSAVEISVYSGLMMLATFIAIFVKYLEKKYYYNKKYLWNFCIGIFLFSFFVIGFILECLGYIKFIVYFILAWPLGMTFFFYGLKTLLSLKIDNGEEDDGIVKTYNLIKKTMKLLYFVDASTLLLYILAMWKKINNGFY